MKAYVAVGVPQSEVESLEALYNATHGLSWAWRPESCGLRWNFTNVTVDPCNGWQGVACGSVSADNLLHLVNISLPSYNLTGSLPDEIAGLAYASFLDLDYNALGGTIPLGLCNLTKLEKLSMRDNFLIGFIPRCLQTNLTSMNSMSLHNNLLDGPITEFGQLNLLRYLSYSYNELTGTLPESFQNLPSLAIIFLSHNHLHGSIDAMANATAASQLSLSHNIFSSTVPESYGQLTELNYLYLEVNNLYGSLPTSFGSMSELIYIIVYNNFFTGPLPSSMANLTGLIELSLDANYFSGSLAEDVVGNWTLLEQANLYSNLFSGSLSSAFTTLARLGVLMVQDNAMTGTLRSAFNTSSQKVLQAVDVSRNFFSGTIPDSIFGESLTTFVAFDCCFSGRIPSYICNSQQLTTLVLDGLTNACASLIWPGIHGSPRVARSVPGTIPSCIWTDLRNLSTLHVSGNGLSGTIPELSSYAQLTDLQLSFNSLTGTIPSSLQHWSMLETLNLEGNKLVGTIKDMQDLMYGYSNDNDGVKVSLSTNRLSGVIPRAMEYANKINIVEGNLFSCSNSHEPPYSDPNSSNFSCGSSLVDIALEIFAIVGGFIVLVLLAGFYFIYATYHATAKQSGAGNMPSAARYVWDLVVHHRHNEIRQLLKQRDHSSPSRLEEGKVFCLQVLLWRSKLMSIVEKAAKEPRLANLVQFVWSLQSICRISVILMMLSVVLGLPMFAVLKSFYRTYTKQYRWEPSGVFLSGYQPAIAIMLFWALLLYITLYLMVVNVPMFVFGSSDQGIEMKRFSRRTSPSLSRDERSSSVSIISSIRSTFKQVNNRSTWLAFSLLFVNIIMILSIKGAFVFFLVTSSTTYAVKMLMTVLLGGVDVLWGSAIVPFIINRLPGLDSTGKMVVKLCTVFFNSIFSSVVAISLADASCFQGLFVSNPQATEKYSIEYCTYYSVNTTQCVSSVDTFDEVATYTPVFYYNYNCYSTVVTEYVPIFFVSYCFLSLAIPAGSILATNSKHSKVMSTFYPAIFWADTVPVEEKEFTTSSEQAKSLEKDSRGATNSTKNSRNVITNQHPDSEAKASTDDVVSELHSTTQPPVGSNLQTLETSAATSRLLFPAFILAAGVHHVMVMLTFGMFYPPLNVLVCLLVCVTAFTWEALIGRWLTTEGEDDNMVLVNSSTLQLNEVCASACCAPRRSLWLLSVGSGVFVGLACWDMAGDALGWLPALWAPLGALAISLLVCLLLRGYNLFRIVEDRSAECDASISEKDGCSMETFASDQPDAVRDSSLWKRMASHSVSTTAPSFPPSVFVASSSRQGRVDSSVEMSARFSQNLQTLE
eukprot:gene26119-31539_t